MNFNYSRKHHFKYHGNLKIISCKKGMLNHQNSNLFKINIDMPKLEINPQPEYLMDLLGMLPTLILGKASL